MQSYPNTLYVLLRFLRSMTTINMMTTTTTAARAMMPRIGPTMAPAKAFCGLVIDGISVGRADVLLVLATMV